MFSTGFCLTVKGKSLWACGLYFSFHIKPFFVVVKIRSNNYVSSHCLSSSHFTLQSSLISPYSNFQGRGWSLHTGCTCFIHFMVCTQQLTWLSVEPEFVIFEHITIATVRLIFAKPVTRVTLWGFLVNVKITRENAVLRSCSKWNYIIK